MKLILLSRLTCLAAVFSVLSDAFALPVSLDKDWSLETRAQVGRRNRQRKLLGSVTKRKARKITAGPVKGVAAGTGALRAKKRAPKQKPRPRSPSQRPASQRPKPSRSMSAPPLRQGTIPFYSGAYDTKPKPDPAVLASEAEATAKRLAQQLRPRPIEELIKLQQETIADAEKKKV